MAPVPAVDADDRRAKVAAVRELLSRRGLLVSAAPALPADRDAGRVPAEPGALPTGFDALDALLPGGFPRRALSEILGPAAGGKTSLVLPALAAATRGGGFVAWVDPAGEAYPPAVAAAGVVLARTLWVRPPAADTPSALWAAEVLLESGAFDAVVLDLSGPAASSRRVRRQSDERRATVLRRAAEGNGSALLLLGEEPLGATPAVRLRVTPGGSAGVARVTIEKSRYGAVGTVLDWVRNAAPGAERRLASDTSVS